MHPVEERRRRAPIEERIESRLPRARCGFNVSRNPPSSPPLSPCPPPPPWCRNHGAAAELECHRGLVEGQERRSSVALIAASLPSTRALNA